MAVHAEKIKQLAAASPNFGRLLQHAPLLVWYGCGAELTVYSDPQGAMTKSRQFAEVVAEMVIRATGTPAPQGKTHLVDLTNLLYAQDVIPKPVYDGLEKIRSAGNKAAHAHYDDLATALACVRTCFVLGVWLHRTLNPEDRAAIAFVPPQPPTKAISQGSSQLREALSVYRKELAEAKLKLQGFDNLQVAVAAAQREAEAAIQAADTEKAAMAALIEQLQDQLAGQVKAFDAEQRPRVKAEDREHFIQRGRRASRGPLNEAEARRAIDEQLYAAGWVIQNAHQMNLGATQNGSDLPAVAVREVTMATGRADYVLYVDRKMVGVIEAKREGTSLPGAELQLARYSSGLTTDQRMTAWSSDTFDGGLPFGYLATGVETQFVNRLDPEPCSRPVFAFHRPETLARWLREAEEDEARPTLRARLRAMPALMDRRLRPAQHTAVAGLEDSLAHDRPRALIQMATGAGKTFTAVSASYRLLKHAKAQRILFLVDRNNLGEQASREYSNYLTPDDGRRFSDLYNIQRLGSNGEADAAKVVISTVQRLFASLQNRDLPNADVDDDALDSYDLDDPAEVTYNPKLPPEYFDLIVVDECHRSIYGKWRAVLEYFDAYLVGLTATPVKQTFGFFERNLVSSYSYEQAVADGVNVDFDVYRIRTRQTDHGDTIEVDPETGTVVPKVDRKTRERRYEELDDDFSYTGRQLGNSVISDGQIQMVIQTFHDRLFSEIFPERAGLPNRTVPKTLIFAASDYHADQVLKYVRQIFGKGNEFAAKITYQSKRDGQDPKNLIRSFRNSPELRIAVTVDMIATGTDIKALECVLFMRAVKSAALFEQMKGRGARSIGPEEFQAVTPDVKQKTRFVIVDAVGVTDKEHKLEEAVPLDLDTGKQISLAKLLTKTSQGTISPDEISTLASRLARLNQQISEEERAELAQQAGGARLTDITRRLVDAIAPEKLVTAKEQGREAVRRLVTEAVRPLAENVPLRESIMEIRRALDITHDEVNSDTLESAGAVPREARPAVTIEDWRAYLDEHRDHIPALQSIYGGRGRVTYDELQQLAARIQRTEQRWTPQKIWELYERLGKAPQVSGERTVTDLITLIRYELGLDEELMAYGSLVEHRLADWLARQEQAGMVLSDRQLWWIDHIKDIVVTSAGFTADDLERVPFTQRGGIEGFLGTFGDDRAPELIDELNRELSA
ncbi:type I restriction endonuclease subunit R [Kitasatospora sp. NBC_01266]|uniref:type I restriction endonuclease subunit R n=1 Tax=Kitasatospora sp. NBC_01266 TaxID=2903572 RepID=UPI002E304736|nr:DEAD/DEAH box helicase family protein [Kitasatospora sp. NBC_01266]